MFALAGENPEVVTMERLGSILAGLLGPRLFQITLCLGLAKSGAKRTGFAIELRGPIETVFFSWGANDLLRILQHFITVVVPRGVFALRLRAGAQGLQRFQFVIANSSIEQLFLPGLGVEEPRCIGADDGNRER